MRGFVAGVVLLVVAVAGYELARQYFFPDIDAGLRLINRKADKHEVAKVKQADPGLQAKVGGDDRDFGSALKQFGSEDGARRADRNAALARADGRIPIKRPPVIWGSQKSWEEKFQANEPLLVTLSPNESMCSSSRTWECWRADGIYHEGTPQHRTGALTVLQNPAPEYGGNPRLTQSTTRRRSSSEA